LDHTLVANQPATSTLVANQPATQYSNGGYFEDFCQASIPIRLGSLKRVLPNQTATDAGEMIAEIVRVTFEEMKPGPGKDYMFHPKIKTFLEETSLDPLASDKRRRVDYRGSSAIFLEIIRSKTWFGCGTMHCPIRQAWRRRFLAFMSGHAFALRFLCLREGRSTTVRGMSDALCKQPAGNAGSMAEPGRITGASDSIADPWRISRSILSNLFFLSFM
jgi:hypothetical protein